MSVFNKWFTENRAQEPVSEWFSQNADFNKKIFSEEFEYTI